MVQRPVEPVRAMGPSGLGSTTEGRRVDSDDAEGAEALRAHLRDRYGVALSSEKAAEIFARWVPVRRSPER